MQVIIDTLTNELVRDNVVIAQITPYGLYTENKYPVTARTNWRHLQKAAVELAKVIDHTPEGHFYSYDYGGFIAKDNLKLQETVEVFVSLKDAVDASVALNGFIREKYLVEEILAFISSIAPKKELRDAYFDRLVEKDQLADVFSFS